MLPDRRASVDFNICKNCSECPAQKGCPSGALIRFEPDEPPFPDSTCQGCGTCVRHCPYKAISLL